MSTDHRVSELREDSHSADPLQPVDYLTAEDAGYESGEEPLGSLPADAADAGETEGFLFPIGEQDQAPHRHIGRIKAAVVLTVTSAAVIVAIVFLIVSLIHSGSGGKESVELKVGQTWIADDQWALTIHSVTRTDKRNLKNALSYTPAEVYLIDYTYTNLNYRVEDMDYYARTGEKWGLYVSMQVYAEDLSGNHCEYYALDGLTDPSPLQPGESLRCQEAIAVRRKGGFSVSGTKEADDAHDHDLYEFTFVYKEP